MILVAILKYLLPSTSDFDQTSHKYDIVLYLVLEGISIVSLEFLHEIFYKLSIKCKCPTIVCDIVFLALYIFIVVVSVLDCENSREM